MHADTNDTELTEGERAMFAALPRESAIEPVAEERLVDALRHEGYFRRRTSQGRWAWQMAAAIALLAGGAFGGMRYAERHSLERMLTSKDLPLSDRVLLLQRAGSAYIQAANGYADATVRIDSSAVEVASQVLLGAASAVARRKMDGGMSASLAALMHQGNTTPQHSISQ